jgi:hypothetical protein
MTQLKPVYVTSQVHEALRLEALRVAAEIPGTTIGDIVEDAFTDYRIARREQRAATDPRTPAERAADDFAAEEVAP